MTLTSLPSRHQRRPGEATCSASGQRAKAAERERRACGRPCSGRAGGSCAAPEVAPSAPTAASAPDGLFLLFLLFSSSPPRLALLYLSSSFLPLPLPSPAAQVALLAHFPAGLLPGLSPSATSPPLLLPLSRYLSWTDRGTPRSLCSARAWQQALGWALHRPAPFSRSDPSLPSEAQKLFPFCAHRPAAPPSLAPTRAQLSTRAARPSAQAKPCCRWFLGTKFNEHRGCEVPGDARACSRAALRMQSPGHLPDLSSHSFQPRPGGQEGFESKELAPAATRLTIALRVQKQCVHEAGF